MRRTNQIQIREAGKPPQTFAVTRDVIAQVSRLVSRPDFVLAEDVLPQLARPSDAQSSVLRGLRHRDGLTQVEVAQKIAATQGDVSKMEKGERPIGKEMARRLAKVFDVDYRLFL